MAVNVLPLVTAFEAEATASGFVTGHLPDRFAAGDPTLQIESEIWRVPVLLAYPKIGSVGQVGEILISARNAGLVSHTPIDEILSRARKLYDEHRDAIEASFS